MGRGRSEPGQPARHLLSRRVASSLSCISYASHNVAGANDAGRAAAAREASPMREGVHAWRARTSAHHPPFTLSFTAVLPLPEEKMEHMRHLLLVHWEPRLRMLS